MFLVHIAELCAVRYTLMQIASRAYYSYII